VHWFTVFTPMIPACDARCHAVPRGSFANFLSRPMSAYPAKADELDKRHQARFWPDPDMLQACNDCCCRMRRQSQEPALNGSSSTLAASWYARACRAVAETASRAAHDEGATKRVGD